MKQGRVGSEQIYFGAPRGNLKGLDGLNPLN